MALTLTYYYLQLCEFATLFHSFCPRWYPPGHGDFYQAFYNSGLLTELVDQGRQFVFMSNIDNMGASVDLGILNLCLKGSHEFIMEVTERTK